MVITLTLIPAAGCSSHVTTVTVSYKVLVNVHVTQGCLTSLVVTTLTLGRFIAVALTQHCHKHNWGVAVVLFWIPCHSCCQETRVTKEALWILTEFIPSERGPNFTHSVQCVRTSIMCMCNYTMHAIVTPASADQPSMLRTSRSSISNNHYYTVHKTQFLYCVKCQCTTVVMKV